MIDYNQFISKIDRFLIKTEIVVSDSKDLYRIEVNRRSNLKSEFNSTMTIRFLIPNRISLVQENMSDIQ